MIKDDKKCCCKRIDAPARKDPAHPVPSLSPTIPTQLQPASQTDQAVMTQENSFANYRNGR